MTNTEAVDSSVDRRVRSQGGGVNVNVVKIFCTAVRLGSPRSRVGITGGRPGTLHFVRVSVGRCCARRPALLLVLREGGGWGGGRQINYTYVCNVRLLYIICVFNSFWGLSCSCMLCKKS